MRFVLAKIRLLEPCFCFCFFVTVVIGSDFVTVRFTGVETEGQHLSCDKHDTHIHIHTCSCEARLCNLNGSAKS